MVTYAARCEAVESVLLQVAVAVQRASDATHALEREAGGEHFVVPLSQARSELNAIWRRLWEAVYTSPSGSEQLALEMGRVGHRFVTKRGRPHPSRPLDSKA